MLYKTSMLFLLFNPGIYPMNPSWLTGKMPVDMYRHEHQADPSVFQNVDSIIITEPEQSGKSKDRG